MVETIVGIAAFAVLFIVWVVLPNVLRKRR
jgi:hypothetical protein